MKLFTKQLPALAREIVEALQKAGDIEVAKGELPETVLDFQAILAEYARAEREVSAAARDLVAARGWGGERYAEARRMVAGLRKLPLDNEAMEYITRQMMEFMMISPRVEEVFADDEVLRKRIIDILRRHLDQHRELDEEVRKRLKHLQEGTRDWEIAYSRTMEQVRRARGLD
jgi:hypothetical protein